MEQIRRRKEENILLINLGRKLNVSINLYGLSRFVIKKKLFKKISLKLRLMGRIINPVQWKRQKLISGKG